MVRLNSIYVDIPVAPAFRTSMFDRPGKDLSLITVGPVVIDEMVLDDEKSLHMSKRDCVITQQLGGGATNISRQSRKLGCPVQEVLFVGDDESGSMAEELARHEFPDAILLHAMQHTRRTIWCEHIGHVLRSRLSIQSVPERARDLLCQAAFTTIAPMTPADKPFILDILTLCDRCVLQLSTQQLQDPESVRELIPFAWLIAVNHSELISWSGIEDIESSLEFARSQGVHRLVVTTDHGAYGLWDDCPFEVTGFPVTSVRQTRGAGDVFLATMLVGLHSRLEWRDSIRLGLAAAALHVGGDEYHSGCRDYLLEMIRTQP